MAAVVAEPSPSAALLPLEQLEHELGAVHMQILQQHGAGAALKAIGRLMVSCPTGQLAPAQLQAAPPASPAAAAVAAPPPPAPPAPREAPAPPPAAAAPAAPPAPAPVEGAARSRKSRRTMKWMWKELLPRRAPPAAQQPLTAAELAAAPPEQQKMMIGERLYCQVAEMQPVLAGKITGMLLEMDNAELLMLLKGRKALGNKVHEAIAVLKQHNVIPEEKA